MLSIIKTFTMTAQMLCSKRNLLPGAVVVEDVAALSDTFHFLCLFFRCPPTPPHPPRSSKVLKMVVFLLSKETLLENFFGSVKRFFEGIFPKSGLGRCRAASLVFWLLVIPCLPLHEGLTLLFRSLPTTAAEFNILM